jgi:cytochrome c biogenesis protein CcdA
MRLLGPRVLSGAPAGSSAGSHVVTLVLIGLVGGVITSLSPCVLPYGRSMVYGSGSPAAGTASCR